MRSIFLILFLTCSYIGFSQISKPLQFSEEIFDFGMVYEQAGPVMHEFSFVNNTLSAEG